MTAASDCERELDAWRGRTLESVRSGDDAVVLEFADGCVAVRATYDDNPERLTVAMAPASGTILRADLGPISRTLLHWAPGEVWHAPGTVYDCAQTILLWVSSTVVVITLGQPAPRVAFSLQEASANGFSMPAV